MKVLQINSVCGHGSTGRIATDINYILERQGHTGIVAYGRNEPVSCNDTLRIGNKLDNYAHIAKTRVLDMHGFGSKKATLNFINQVKEINPDIIHLHNLHGYYINIEILFKYLKEANKPVIWTLHDCWPFTGHCAYFEYSDCKCWEIGSDHKCIQQYSYPASYGINNSKKNYARKKDAFLGVDNLVIVTPSNWLAQLVNKSFLKEYPVEVINNGVDLTVFKPTSGNFRREYMLEEKFIILGIANHWEPRKGLAYFVDLASTLKDDEVIVLVGLTKKQLDTLPENIKGISKTNDIRELVEIYTESDLFVNPTLEDNFPTTNLEALACGTPVITFKTGGSPESINKSVGEVIEKGNMNALINAIAAMKKKRVKSESCISHAQNFNKDNKFVEYIALYEKMLEVK